MTHDGPTGDGPAPAEPPATPSPQPESTAVPTAEPEPVAESAAVPTDPAAPTPEPADVPGFAPAVVPPKRRLGLVLGLVGGAVALVLLLCAVLVPLALHGATTTRAGAATAASPTPSPSAAPMSAQAYQAMLDTVDTELKAPMDTLGSATQPADVHAFGTSLSGAIQEATVGLRSITPPAAVARANEELAGALDSLGTQAEDLSTTDSGARICAGSAGLARLTQSTAAQNVRDAVHSLATADSSTNEAVPESVIAERDGCTPAYR